LDLTTRVPALRMTESRHILGVRVDATTYRDAAQEILAWAESGESRYVCCGCVNHIIEARDSLDFQKVMAEADLVTTDGMPLVWFLRLLGLRHATRVYGPNLMQAVLQGAAAAGVPIGLFGGSEPVLRQLVHRITARFPGIRIAYAESPPFRPMTDEENQRTVAAIREAGVRILFIGLSTPKQDRWMHAHRGRIPAVMLGVGAAFDFLAGAKPQAPPWIQHSGFEWLFRLATEPRRLGRRYLRQNPRFAVLALMQILRKRFS
jgi:N-acetylglucosaminyldiphosphoundecaprenol N-acetyl-beta-D-mannosaminyltransferase